MKDRISDNMYNMLISVSTLISDIIKNNKTNVEYVRPYVFENFQLIDIPIDNYLERLVRYSNIDDSTIILMLIYIDRICEYNNFTLLMENIHW